MRPRNRLACGWALVVLIGVVINLVVLVVTPVLRPELNLLEKSLSYYAVGPWGAIQAAAFLALGISSMALGVALLGAHIPSPWMWPIVLLLIISGVASLGLVWYPMEGPGAATILGRDVTTPVFMPTRLRPPKNRACSIFTQRSMTTSSPASRAIWAASSLTIPSCIQSTFAPMAAALRAIPGSSSARRNTSTISTGPGISSSEE